MSDPIAYFLTWTTYGTWLHGDFRGWVEKGRFDIQPPDPVRETRDRGLMSDEVVVLEPAQRKLIEVTIGRHCEIRTWHLHAVNARTNHVHAVVSASVHPDVVMSQFKAWCSRRLSEQAGLRESAKTKNGRKRWFTEHGSTKWINDDDYFENAVRYVNEGQ